MHVLKCQTSSGAGQEKLLCNLILDANMFLIVEVSFVSGSALSVSSMVVHADRGLREATMMNVKWEMGWGIVNTTGFCYSFHSLYCEIGSFQVY